MGLTAYGPNSNCVYLGIFACKCFAHEADGDCNITGIITILFRGIIDGHANKDKTILTCLFAIYHSLDDSCSNPCIRTKSSKCVSVFLRIPLSHTVYFSKEAIYVDVWERQTQDAVERQKIVSWQTTEGHKVDGVFCIADALLNMGCHLYFYANTRIDSVGTWGISMHA